MSRTDVIFDKLKNDVNDYNREHHHTKGRLYLTPDRTFNKDILDFFESGKNVVIDEKLSDEPKFQPFVMGDCVVEFQFKHHLNLLEIVSLECYRLSEKDLEAKPGYVIRGDVGAKILENVFFRKVQGLHRPKFSKRSKFSKRAVH